jgi:hypothetical protein
VSATSAIENGLSRFIGGAIAEAVAIAIAIGAATGSAAGAAAIGALGAGGVGVVAASVGAPLQPVEVAAKSSEEHTMAERRGRFMREPR